MADPTARTSALQPGDVLLGRYRLLRVMGEGGMGVVWEGRQVTTERPVAIKVLKENDAANAARFVREAKVAASLSHRNIVQVYDYWEVEGGGPVFLVMELLQGESLAALLERVGRLTVKHTLSIMTGVAAALRAAHGAGVVHRDLKPDNIFLSHSAPDDPVVDIKVLDFGLAKTATPDIQATAVTQTGSVMGTPFYMAPEQVYGEKNVDLRADIWAFGVILYECLSGTKPFQGENFGQVFRSITQGAHVPLRALVPNVPPALDALVTRALTHTSAARPSAADLCLALGQVEDAPRPPSLPPLPTSTARISSPPRTAALNPSPAPRTMIAAATSVRTERRSRLHVSAAVGAGLLVAIGAAGTFAIRSAAVRAGRPDERVTLPDVPLPAASGSGREIPSPTEGSPFGVPPEPTRAGAGAGTATSTVGSAKPDAPRAGRKLRGTSPEAGHGDPLDGRF